MNVAERFGIRNAATGSMGFPTTGPAELHGWGGPGSRLEIAYVIENDFGVETITTGVFGMKCAATQPDELQRKTIVDAAGLIEQFSASNMSAVLAQPANVLDVPRALFLKRGPELTGRRDEMVSMYVVSDPFRALSEKLVDLGRADVNDPGEVPAEIALANAGRVLDGAREASILPSRILRGFNGVFVYFSNATRYAEIECDNDGDVGIVMSDRSGNPTLWLSESHQLRLDLARIRAFLV